MTDVIVIGGGLAGLAAAAAVAGSGHSVQVLEARPFLGGRATSYALGASDDSETIDNCQHILLRCCVNLLDFYQRLGVADDDWVPSRVHCSSSHGGQQKRPAQGMPPAPLHFTGSFLKLGFQNLSEKLAVARAIWAIRTEHSRRGDLDQITMQKWLEEKRQPPRAIERFWRQVLVSAINEDLDRMVRCCTFRFQVFRLGFLARSDSYEMGVPSVPLGRLYGSDSWQRIGRVEIRLRTPVDRWIVVENGSVRCVFAGGRRDAG